MSQQLKTTIGMGLGLLAVTVMGGLSYYSMARNDDERGWVSHTHLVIESIDAFAYELQETAAEPNGFTSTELVRFNSAIQDLRSLTNDNPDQQSSLDSLQNAFSAISNSDSKSVQQAATDTSRIGVPHLERTKALKEIQTLLAKMRTEENRLLNERNEAVEVNASRTRLAIVFGNLLALALIAATMFAATREMTARQKAEDALRKTEVTFRGLLESAPDAIVVVDRRGEIVLVNAQMENVFGYEREELIGHNLELLMPECFRETHHGYMTGFFNSPHTRPMGKGLDLFGQRKDGTEFPVEISLSPLSTNAGMWVSAAIRDVTGRKQIEREIKRLNQRLEDRAAELLESNQELEAFTYTAAHDLRAPLRHVHGYSTFLKELWYERMDDEGRHFLDRIMTATQSMGTLLDDLLNFSRLGRVEMHQQQVNLSKLVQKIRQEMRPDARMSTLDWDIGELPEVEGDQGLLYQVLFNLLSNAVKYSRKTEHPKIEIGSQVDDDETVTIFVRDNGTGFDMNYANKLFQVFQRLHRSKDFEGTGIGLAIVRRVIERHGGRVWAEGAIGQGATFYFSLPIRRTEHGQSRVHTAGR